MLTNGQYYLYKIILDQNGYAIGRYCRQSKSFDIAALRQFRAEIESSNAPEQVYLYEVTQDTSWPLDQDDMGFLWYRTGAALDNGKHQCFASWTSLKDL